MTTKWLHGVLKGWHDHYLATMPRLQKGYSVYSKPVTTTKWLESLLKACDDPYMAAIVLSTCYDLYMDMDRYMDTQRTQSLTRPLYGHTVYSKLVKTTIWLLCGLIACHDHNMVTQCTQSVIRPLYGYIQCTQSLSRSLYGYRV